MSTMTAYPPILVVDMETTSDHRTNAGIVEIGALWLEPTHRGNAPLAFEMKCRPHPDAADVQFRAMEVNGCDWLDDPTVASEAEAIRAFADWLRLSGQTNIVMAGQNVGQFDFTNLEAAFGREGLAFPFSIRVVDVQTLAFANAPVHYDEPTPAGGMKSSTIQAMLGLPEEPKPHRALCGALLEAHALNELLYMRGPAPIEYGEIELRFFPARGHAPLKRELLQAP